MADENTPLTSSMSHGPENAFPGGVSPRSRRNKVNHYQCAICLAVIGIIVLALILTLIYGNIFTNSSVFLANETAADNKQNAALPAVLLVIPPNVPIPDEPESDWALHDIKINKTASDAALNVGIKALGDKEILEESSETTPIDTPSYRHYRSLSTNVEARKLARRGFVENRATMHLADTFNYTKGNERENIGRGPTIIIPDPTLNFTCNFNARYRNANGVCNNKLHPRTYGAALIPYRRMVAPDYADGVTLPRTGHNGTELPSAREVSLKIHRKSYDTDSNFTVMLAVFGQFLDHDITATVLTSLQEGESINCCTVPLNIHPECFPVPIRSGDPFYELYNVTCMNFVRSAPAPTGHFGPRAQLNQATAFIDGSVVYGSSDERQRRLRSFSNGTLRMFETEDGRQLLPISTNPDDGCNRKQMSAIGRYCFESGDARANENLLLTSIHLVFARHHNFLAKGLQEMNPEWTDETIYQESRKILSAQMAHITYNEFLPILLGRKLADKKGLLPNMDDLNAPDTYDAEVDPSIANSFAAAAFRFAHTLLPTLFNLTRDNTTEGSIALHKMLFNPFSLWAKRGVNHAVETAVNTPVQRVDRFFSTEVTQKLFQRTSEDKIPICGLDLVSLNIQRGRDHGLPSYSVFREHCRLSPVNTWEEFAEAVDHDALKSIMEIYKYPTDVDVYTGALSEPPLEGAIFGPLLTCIVSDQFMRIKLGDSHWYERKMGPQKFTKDQLREIYKTTLAEIICRNADSLEQTKKYVMEHRPDEILDCKTLESFNFAPWQAKNSTKKLHSAAISVPWQNVRVMKKSVQKTSIPKTLKSNETS